MGEVLGENERDWGCRRDTEDPSRVDRAPAGGRSAAGERAAWMAPDERRTGNSDTPLCNKK